MAVCKTMKTQNGISKFLINSDYENESIAAFVYDDGKIEVHSLKKECAPLHVETDSLLGTVYIDTIGVLVYVLTPNQSNNTLDFAIWDVGSFVGFTPKELHRKSEPKQDVKYKISFNIQNLFSDTLSKFVSTAHSNHICIIMNNKHLLLLEIDTTSTNSIDIDIANQQTLPENLKITNVLLFENNNELIVIYSNLTSIHVLPIKQENVSSSTIHLPIKKTKTMSISCFVKISPSKCIVVDNLGKLYLFLLPRAISEIKLPNSIYGHGVCAVGNLKQEGVLAVCNDNHTINLYLVKDIINSCSENGSSTFIKPYRLLCSQYPINSVVFMKGDQLAMASSANKLLTFWGGVSPTFNIN